MQDRPTTRPTCAVPVALLVPCVALNAVVLCWIMVYHPPLNVDFLGFWSYPRFFPLRAIYNLDAMMRFQQALYPGFHSFYPFIYPPDALLVCSWLRGLDYNTARVIWLAGGLTAFAAAGLALLHGRGLAVMALLASPAALLCIVLGQSSFFIGALLLGGLAALPRWPVLAGMLFGLLTLKPQLGLLLPVLLIARGDWRAILTAMLTTAALVAFSCAVQPPALWVFWLSSLSSIQNDYFSGGISLTGMISPAATMLRLGAGPGVAMITQGLSCLMAVFLTWRAARYGTYEQAAAMLLAATLLAQPHAYAYDAVVLPAALILAGPGPRWVQAIMALIYIYPLILLSSWPQSFYYAPILAGFTVILAFYPLGPPPEGIIMRAEKIRC